MQLDTSAAAFDEPGGAAAPPPPPEPLQVTLAEAGRLLAYDIRTVYRLIARGELSTIGRGHLRRISMQSLREYQERHRCQ